MKTIGGLVSGREIFHVRSDHSVRDAARYMTDRRVGAVAVLDGTRLVGILSERDVMGRVVARQLDPDRTRVGEVMTKDLVVAQSDESHEEGLRRMKQAFRQLHECFVFGHSTPPLLAQHQIIPRAVTASSRTRPARVYRRPRDWFRTRALDCRSPLLACCGKPTESFHRAGESGLWFAG